MRYPKTTTKRACTALLLASVTAAIPALFTVPTFAQRDSSALINEALDKPVDVQLKTTLPSALQEIKTRTGVPIELAPGVLDLLPWGEQTNIDAKVSNQTLRQAVSAIARKLGLIYVLTPEAVELRPMPALQRLGRRATVDELGVLDLLASNPLQGAGAAPPAAATAGTGPAAQGRQTVSQLLQAVDQRLIELKSPFAIEYRAGTSGVKDNQPISVPRNATIADALDAIAKETPLAWGPWGHSVLVKPKEAWVRDQLEKPLSRRFIAMDVAQVLSELADYSGVNFAIEPGALQKVSQQAKTVTLESENRSVQQVLELIAGFTGLNWTANESGVYVWNPSTGAGAAGGSGDPVVAILPLSDRGIEVMIRQSELPDDLRQYIRHRKGKAIDQLQQQMKAEGFVPAATQPATQPSGEPKDL